MRQAGILAAGGLYALDHHRARLAEDHANAKALAEALADAPGIHVDLTTVQTNIVMIDLERGTAARRRSSSRARQTACCSARRARSAIRAVTHLDVDREGVHARRAGDRGDRREAVMRALACSRW